MRARAALAAAVLAFGALLAFAPAASAHDRLDSTSPKQGSSVATAPAAVTMTFNEPAFKLGSRIRVIGPSGDVAVGDPVFKDRTVRQALQPGVPAGDYTVEWQVTSADGHPIAGTWSFTAQQAGVVATTPATTTPAAAPTEDAPPTATVSTRNTGAETGGSSTGIIVGVTAVVAVVLLAAAGGVALTRRRNGG